MCVYVGDEEDKSQQKKLPSFKIQMRRSCNSRSHILDLFNVERQKLKFSEMIVLEIHSKRILKCDRLNCEQRRKAYKREIGALF
jgi:hypothetical protein